MRKLCGCEHRFECCKKWLGGYKCNRAIGHRGIHVACSNETHHLVLWYSKPPDKVGKVWKSKVSSLKVGLTYPEST